MSRRYARQHLNTKFQLSRSSINYGQINKQTDKHTHTHTQTQKNCVFNIYVDTNVINNIKGSLAVRLTVLIVKKFVMKIRYSYNC